MPQNPNSSVKRFPPPLQTPLNTPEGNLSIPWVNFFSQVHGTYSLYFLYPGKPTASAILMQWPCPGPGVFPQGVTLQGDMVDSAGNQQVVPASSVTLPVYKIPAGTAVGTTPGAEGTQIATITVNTSGVYSFSTTDGTTSGVPIPFAKGDTLAIWAPSVQDSNWSSPSLTVVLTW